MNNELELIGDLTDEMGNLMGKYLGKDVPVFAVIAVMEYHKYSLLNAVKTKSAPEPTSDLIKA